MNKRMCILAVLLFAATPALAQSPVSVTPRMPVAELFGGFSYARLNDGGTTSVMSPKSLTHGFFGPNLFAQGGVFLLKKTQ